LRPEVLVFPLILCSAAVVWAGWTIAAALRRPAAPAALAGDAAADRALALLQTFAPGIAASTADPRAMLTWVPLAQTARQLYPDAFALLDKAAGARFPFTSEQVLAAHARWSSDWLAWERAHDGEYKLKAAVAEAELIAAGNTPIARARLDAVEREKLELYQRRYEEYVRVSKQLQTLSK